jgi:YD repeat-containing protein
MKNFHYLKWAAAFLLGFPLFIHGGGVVSTCTESALTNALAGGGTVTFGCSGTIVVANTIVISTNTIMNASGSSVLISGGDWVRVFLVNTNVTLTMYNVTICNGRAGGGAGIRNDGTLVAYECAFQNNHAWGAAGTTGTTETGGADGGPGGNGAPGTGGAIRNFGTLRLSRCSFQTNSAIGGNGGAGGGALAVPGAGGAGGDGASGQGGAIYSSGTAFITNCTFEANIAIGGNAGAGGRGPLFDKQRIGAPGAAASSSGGALDSPGTATVIGCTFTENESWGGDGQNGGQRADWDGRDGSDGAGSFGGAICNSGTGRFANCTIYFNISVGGDGGDGGFSRFNGGDGGRGGNGWGGGLYSSGTAYVTNSTFASSGAYGGIGGAYGAGGGVPNTNGVNGAAGDAKGGNIANNAGTFHLRASILAYRLEGGEAFGAITDAGRNISDGAFPTFTEANSVNNTDPLLVNFADNGGFTKTCALATNSPAIDQISLANCPDTDQRWYARSGLGDIGAYEYNGLPPMIYVAADGPTATEDGQVGLLRIYQNNILSFDQTVTFVVEGTASNGVDYVLITNSITIAAGDIYSTIWIRALLDTLPEDHETVTIALLPAPHLILTPPYDRATVTLSDRDTVDRSARFVRGTSTDVNYHSFVIPLNFQKGVRLNESGGNATTFFPGNIWTNSRYHFNASNTAPQVTLANRLAYQNPIVAFGSQAGGVPLYITQPYAFGVYSGNPGANLTNSLRIRAYYRTNWTVAGTINIVFPSLSTYLQNGLTVTTEAFGLKTVITDHPYERWGLVSPFALILTHTASVAATNYFFVVQHKGTGLFGEPLVLDASGAQAWSDLYVFNFSERPSAVPIFVDQPQFEGKPLPPEYLGKSLQELTNLIPTMPSLSGLAPSNYLAINGSPELRQHPILDSFVQDMGNDPIALANYVINEIDLVDAVDYDTNQVQQTAIYLGGVNRSALATFQEEQGSPVEQCALLVYLLRKAGVPAVYVFPTNNGLQMLDSQLSKLLQMQLKTAKNATGQTNLPTLLPVNYPWVAVYLTNETRWVHVFPWLKDTEIVEGLNIYDYLPTNYNSGRKFLVQYCLGDTNILSLSSVSDQPSDLLPKFIQRQLDTYAPGLSVHDMGMHVVNRRNLYTRWDDFPKPFSLTGAPLVWESLKTNLALFNTLQVKVYSALNPYKSIDTTEMLMADLHNRKLLLRFEQHTNTGPFSHEMILSLGRYAPNITNVGAFATNADPTLRLTASRTDLFLDDDEIRFQVTHRRLRMALAGYSVQARNIWEFSYVEQSQQIPGLLYQGDESFRKGDLVALTFHVGRASRRMLNVHAEELWNFSRNLDTNNPATMDKEVYQGTAAYLLAMSYFHSVADFLSFNDALHKVRFTSMYQHGFGLIRPQRDTNGALINYGAINLVEPALHIPNNGLGSVFNCSFHPDSGIDHTTASQDWWYYMILQGSAAEHGALKSYYKTNAISTVNLLQQVSTNMLRLNQENYATYGDTTFGGKMLKEHDPLTWNSVVEFFETGFYDAEVLITPGTVTNGSYRGVAAFLVSAASANALVSGFNGGFSQQFPSTTFAEQNVANLFLEANPETETTVFSLRTSPTANNSGYVLDAAPADWKVWDTYTQILNGQIGIDPALLLDLTLLNGTYGQLGGTAAAGYEIGQNDGAIASHASAYDLKSFVQDPVNVMNGEFYVDTVDLSLPGPVPVQVRRNYGSQNLAENEFGFGWKINYVPFLSINSDSSLIFAAEMDGSTVAYRQQTTDTNVYLPTASDNPMLNNNSSAGPGSTANLFNNRLTLSTVSGTNIYILGGANGSVRTYATRSYPVGSFNRTRPYLDSWKDSQGNAFTFQYGTNSTQPDYGQLRRMQSSSGNFLGFYYDVYGHILEAYTGDGRRLKYEYDGFGDLVQVTLPDTSEIKYEYQHSTFTTNGATHEYSTHLIAREFKPDGRVLQNDYDSQRRVTNQWATVGPDLRLARNARFVYTNNFSLVAPTNVITGKTDVYDVFDNLTTYYYTNSLIRRTTDPLNQTEWQDWYESDTGDGGYRRSLKSRTDKRGLVTTYKYDASGNVTNVVAQGDLTGTGNTSEQALSTFTYTTNNLPLVSVNPSGTTNKHFYTNGWLLSRTETSALNAQGANIITNLFLYTSVTNPINSAQFSLGVGWRAVQAEGSADAATKDFLHDYRGFVTNEIEYTGTTDANVTNQFVYNARGELIEIKDGAGRKTKFDYDALGRPKYKETYEAGQSLPIATEYSYFNPNGELVWRDGPRSDPEDYLYRDYDGAGRQILDIQWRSQAKADGSGVEASPGYAQYAAAFQSWDGFGNLTKITDPRGVVVTNGYDALGQRVLTKVFETNGNVLRTELFTYEAGQVTFATNALGGVTEIQYTTNGLKRFQKNPDGSTNSWTYYVDGRPKREIQRNGAYWERTYDDANRRITNIFYSSSNTRLATNITELDRRGNVFRAVDAFGSAFTNKYDGLNRLKWSAGPVVSYTSPPGAPASPGGVTAATAQQASTNYYDAVGFVTTNINALGEKTITYSDVLGRPTRIEIRDAANNLVRESASAYAANHQSTTVTNGSSTAAVPSTTFTDNQGNTVLSIGYPASGVKHFSKRYFDAVGNLVSEAVLSLTNTTTVEWQTATFAYDGLRRLISKTELGGASTTFAYDAAGNETNRTMPGGLSWRARYNTAGQIIEEYNLGAGGAGTRTNTYTYYLAGSPFAGLLQTSTDNRGVTCTYNYDDWLRPSTNTHSGPLDEQDVVTTFIYDPRSLPTEITEKFSDPATGPSTSLQRTYDPYGNLKSESVFVGGLPVTASVQAWDSAGRRNSVGFGYQVFGFNLTWQADGRLRSFQGPTGAGLYSYDSAGQINSRNISNQLGARITTTASRDGMGRPLSVNNTTNGTSVLAETLEWTGDGLLATHTLERSDFTDSREYKYANLSRRLIEEKLDINISKRWTNSITYDNGQTGKAGVPTRIGQPEANGAAWKGGTDAFSRITAETNNVLKRTASGAVNGPATIRAVLDGAIMPAASLGTNGGQWQADLELTPGKHQLVMSAVHPSGLYTASATSWFTNNIGSLTATDTLDGTGNVTLKVWKNPNGTTNRTQALTWDARNRLVKATDRDSTQTGKDWFAVYDPLNRLFRTVETPVVSNIVVSAKTVTVEHYYDPQFEFLEVGVSENGATTWKVLGPDLDGTYGGQNGTGGFEAIVPGPELFCPIVADSLGNVHAVYDQNHQQLTWYSSRVTAYGAVPGYGPVPLGQLGSDLGAKFAYHNRAQASIGYTWMGANWYDPVSAQFLKHDAYGHNSSMNGRTPFGGNPLMYWDSDGRLAKGFNAGWNSTASPYGSSGAFDAAYMAGGIFGGSHEGLAEGSAILANAATLGKFDNLSAYANSLQGGVYDASRISSVVGLGALGLATGMAALEAPGLYVTATEVAATPWTPVALSGAAAGGYTYSEGGSFGDVAQATVMGGAMAYMANPFPIGGQNAPPPSVNVPPPRGSLNPRTQAAALAGSALHADRPGNLPDQLRNVYPETQFRFTPSGQAGQDVQAIEGMHPSAYPYGNWPAGVNYGDFKPNTASGWRTFRSDQLNKWTEPTHILPYDPKTGKLVQ